MTLDKLTKIDGGGINTTSDYRVGIITARKFIGPFDGTGGNFTGVITATDGVFSGNISAVDGNFSGNVTIGGTLTYEDVTNIDSVGIITARDGIDCNGDLDVDGHTNLDNVSVAGVTTFAQKINLSSNFIRNCRGFNSGNQQARIVVKAGDDSAGGGLRIVEYFNDDTTLFSSEIANFYTNGIELKEQTTILGHLLPATDSNYDLGTNSVRWRNLYADTLYGDGSNLTGITQTTINSNTNNYLITGTGTANTLQGEANMTFDGSLLTIAKRVVIGNGSEFQIPSRSNTSTYTPQFQITGAWNNPTHGGTLALNGRNDYPIMWLNSGATMGNGAGAGTITFSIKDSAGNYCNTATIRSQVDGTPGNNDSPGRLQFMTTPDNTCNPVERLRITSGGQVNIGGNYEETSHPFNISHSTKPSLALHTGTTLRADLSATTGITSIRSYSNSPFTVNIGGSGETEAFRITGSGEVLIGGIRTSNTGFGNKVLISGGTLGLDGNGSNIGMHFHRNSGDTEGYIGIGPWAVTGGNDDDFGIAAKGDLIFGTSSSGWAQKFMIGDDGYSKFGTGTARASVDIKQRGNSWEDALLIQHDNANTGWNIHAERTNKGLWIGYNSNTNAALTDQSASQVVHINGNRTVSLVHSTNSYELTIGGISGGPTLWLRDSGTTGTPRILFGSTAGALIGAISYNNPNDYMSFYTNGTEHIRINSSGHFNPVSDASRDLGTSSTRWRNVYTTDLQLSNENTGGNEVDGTEGNWTLQEGESDIYMINRKTGKKYKMMLQEVS